jgi:hypothetical protein
MYNTIRDRVFPGDVFINIKSTESLEKYLIRLKEINISILESKFGDFMTNDKRFLDFVHNNINAVGNKLLNRLTKPEVIWLSGEPGSGKTFFIEQYIDQLENLLVDIGLDKNVAKVEPVWKNVSAYQNINHAFNDIILSTLIALTKHFTVALFIDEVDTKLADESVIPRLTGPIYGQDFFFSGHSISLSNQQLIIFLASSIPDKEFQKVPKAQDSTSRIPQHNIIKLPRLNENYMEKIYCALGIIIGISEEISKIEIPALMYIGLQEWQSTRELELLLRHVVGSMPSGKTTLDLFDFALTGEEFEEFQSKYGLNLFSLNENVLKVTK